MNKFTILGCGSSLGSPWITNYSAKLKKNSKNIWKVLPGLEPGLQGSKPWVLTNYTIEPQSRVAARQKVQYDTDEI